MVLLEGKERIFLYANKLYICENEHMVVRSWKDKVQGEATVHGMVRVKYGTTVLT